MSGDIQRVKGNMGESDSNRLFRFISENEGLSVQRISEKLGWAQSKTNRTLSVLERKEWIVRRVFSTAQPMTAVKQDERIQLLKDKPNDLPYLSALIRVYLSSLRIALYLRRNALVEKFLLSDPQPILPSRQLRELVAGAEGALSKLCTPGG